MSITNCIKELDALEKLVLSGEFSREQIADWLSEVSWNLAQVFRRQRYDSDEFQHILRKLMKERRRVPTTEPQEGEDEG